MSTRFETVIAALLFALGCGSGMPATAAHTSVGETAEAAPSPEPERTRTPPPAPGPAADVHLPPIARVQLANGLEINTVHTEPLPLVYVRLTIRSGLDADPAELPGLARLVASMLREGTRRRTSAQLAEAIEFLGADLTIFADAESIVIQIRALEEHLDEVMDLIAETATQPRFDDQELRRLKAREADRLRIEYSDPAMLARREFYRAIYGEHPYAHVDLSEQSLDRARRQDLVSWHRDQFAPNNAFLVVVGRVSPEAVQSAAQRAFGSWRQREVRQPVVTEVPPRTAREVVIVHRPGSAQSVIAVGNLAIPRAHPDYIPLTVANQVLGGSVASRLFMDLRQARSLTYGAYSSIDQLSIPAPFRARAAVGRDPRQPDVDRTALAMDAFMEHLDRIVTEAPPAEELLDAERYLSDSFPLQIETAARIVGMVSELRIFGLADDYFDQYRSQIRAVTPEQALAAARAHIHPENALVLVVGDAEVIAEPLRRWGPVRVIDANGQPISTFEAASSARTETGPQAP